MIASKEDLKYYWECDRIALRQERKHPRRFLPGDEIWKYQRLLRRTAYYHNCKRKNPYYKFLKWRLHRLEIKLGIFIPLNAFGPGLSIAHIGPIHVNHKCKIGANCRIQTGVTLGGNNGVPGVPQLGDNIFLAEGCKLIGNITVADNVQIGANAVVVKSIEEPGTTWGGIPAGKISDKSSANNLIRATELVKR